MTRSGRACIAAMALTAACGEKKRDAVDDTAFAALQERGHEAMGVDPYTSRHRFTPLRDGGVIELQRDENDSTDVRAIRSHLQHVTTRFAQGDFAQPSFVHDTAEVPGTAEMRRYLPEITWRYEERPRGGAIRIRTANPAAVRAVHEFLAFQRRDHRVH